MFFNYFNLNKEKIKYKLKLKDFYYLKENIID